MSAVHLSDDQSYFPNPFVEDGLSILTAVCDAGIDAGVGKHAKDDSTDGGMRIDYERQARHRFGW